MQTEETNEQLVTNQLKSFRDKLQAELNLCDQAEALMMKLPKHAIEDCYICNQQLIIYNQGREEALDVIKALGGKWKKRINPSYSDKIDYQQAINGVPVEIYAAVPPPTCRIVETEIDVPAHKAVRRDLICH